MPVIDTALGWMPMSIRKYLLNHRELVKFALVGGTAFLVDTAIFEGLKVTILSPKPVTAKVVSSLIATILSYILNREWSFRTRGGLGRRYEAGLFFLVSGMGMALNAAPLWLSRYGFDLRTPNVSTLVQEIADFASAQIIGTLIAMGFRYWAFRKFVFPAADVRPDRVRAVAAPDDAGADELDVSGMGGLDVDEIAADMLGDPWPFEEPDDVLDADTQELPTARK
jgi:putative flippase GtrA